MMNAEEIIDIAIEKGQAEGLSSLSNVEKLVFLISEAEVYCDMDGIDSLLDHYPKETIADCALSFRSIGAIDIAEALLAIVGAWPDRPDDLLERANILITDRIGYEYESIVNYINGKVHTTS